MGGNLNPISTTGAPRASLNSTSALWRGNLPGFLIAGLAAAAIALRDPRFLTQPRFWAEEGMLHFAYSYSHGWFEALLNPQVGYLNFWPNLATLLATLPPLEDAPLVTTLMAFAVQMIPVALILWSRSAWWGGWGRRALGVAVALLVPLSTEGWLNTINSFTFLATAAFLILIDDAPRGHARRWVYRGLLLLCGLTGTLACFLVPLFLLDALWPWGKVFPRRLAEIESERLVQGLILAACAVLQVVLIFSVRTYGSVGQRFAMVGLSTLGAALWTQSIGLLAAGQDQARAWANFLLDLAFHNTPVFQLWGRGLLAAVGAALILLSANLPARLRALFLSSYGILLVLSIVFSIIAEKYTFIHTGLHQRLFLAPNTILGWMLVLGARVPQVDTAGWRRMVGWAAGLLCALLLGAALFWGSISYRERWVPADQWPDWPAEVRAWRGNPQRPLHIQPVGWTMELKKRDN